MLVSAMSEYTDVSLKAYEAVTKDDLDAFLAVTDENVEFNSLMEDKTYRGHDGVREWWGNVINALADVPLELADVSDDGDRGFVKIEVKGGDSALPDAIWQAAKVKGGKAVWWGIFTKEKQAVKALKK
jgi:ketosteroid isomerase-like protein